MTKEQLHPMSAPDYIPLDSLVYLVKIAETMRDTAFDSLPDDHGRHDDVLHELADKLHEIAKVARREAQAHGCAKLIHYSSGGLVVTPGKVWHPLEVQS